MLRYIKMVYTNKQFNKPKNLYYSVGELIITLGLLQPIRK